MAKRTRQRRPLSAELLGLMTEAELLDLVAGWIQLQHTPKDSPERETLFWAFERERDLVHDDPDTAWRFILEVLRRDDSIPIMENLSAGPLEDLLAEHGPKVIDRVEAEARSNPAFAKLLGGVWQNTMSDSIWARVQAAWDRRGWDGIPEA
jgi:hypothetical protein